MAKQQALELSDKKLEIVARKEGDTWIISGETWLRRRTLGGLGGVWDKQEKVWVFMGELPEDVRQMVTVWDLLPVTHLAPLPAVTPEPEVAPQPPVIKAAAPALPGWFVQPSWWSIIQLYVKHRPATAVVGPAGNGKTTAVEQALAFLNIPFLSLSCTDRTEVVDLVGGTVLTAAGEEWRDGLVTQAFKEGKAVVLDEADTLDPRVFMALQNALQDGGVDNTARFVNTPAGRVYPAANCPIILCMNTTGDGPNRTYNGRNKLDAASLDRLSYISTGYENEVEILAGRGYSKFTARQVVAWANAMRRKLEENGLAMPLSPRTLLRMAQGVETFGWSLETAADMEFFTRLDADRQSILR